MFDSGVILLEVFLFDFAGDLYGRSIDVAFIGWIREEAVFGSVDELMSAMQNDAAKARAALKRAGDQFPPI
jgi:riboflavin kinase/FMN adenylyltransferase